MTSVSAFRAVGPVQQSASLRPRALGPYRAQPFVGAAAGPHRRRRTQAVRAASSADPADGPFPGQFGEWTITSADKLEVWTYRACISVVAAAFAAGTAAALAPDAGWAQPLQQQGSLLAAAGGAGMAGVVALVHIYVAPLKRLLQALLGVGAAGAAYLAWQHPGVPLPAVVAADPGAVWLVGPAFAALTGICFKEGFCYRKQESWALSLLLPTLLLGHLSGLLPEAGEKGLAAVVAALLLLFAARKYTQPVREDIGDKSIFEFYAMSEDQQRARLEQLRLQVADYGSDEEPL